jgi:hypothetical protein
MLFDSNASCVWADRETSVLYFRFELHAAVTWQPSNDTQVASC